MRLQNSTPSPIQTNMKTDAEILALHGAHLDEFTRHYIICALWSTNDNTTEQGGEPLSANYSEDDLAPETYEAMRNDCADFMTANADLLEESGLSIEQQGHDFWLSRNGHGAGFFDRGTAGLWDVLQDAAKVYGSVDLYVGDDGKIYS